MPRRRDNCDSLQLLISKLLASHAETIREFGSLGSRGVRKIVSQYGMCDLLNRFVSRVTSRSRLLFRRTKTRRVSIFAIKRASKSIANMVRGGAVVFVCTATRLFIIDPNSRSRLLLVCVSEGEEKRKIRI